VKAASRIMGCSRSDSIAAKNRASSSADHIAISDRDRRGRSTSSAGLLEIIRCFTPRPGPCAAPHGYASTSSRSNPWPPYLDGLHQAVAIRRTFEICERAEALAALPNPNAAEVVAQLCGDTPPKSMVWRVDAQQHRATPPTDQPPSSVAEPSAVPHEPKNELGVRVLLRLGASPERHDEGLAGDGGVKSVVWVHP